ncbi:MAG: ABC transporter permease [Planctomycetota bacterium]
MTGQRTLHTTRLTWIAARCYEPIRRIAESLGRAFVNRWSKTATTVAVLLATLGLAIRPSSWTPPVRAVLARQMLFTAVDAIPAALRAAAAVGVLLIVQASIWIDMVGVSTEVIAPIIWRSIVREIAPLLACLVVIGRSGIAISAELGTMRAGEEVDVLDSQGIDPMTFLIMPRVLAVMFSAFCLAVIIAVTMVVTGYAVGAWMEAIRNTWEDFLTEISRNFDFPDVVFFATKTLVAGGFAGAICCVEGISVRDVTTDVPRVTSRAGIRALTAVFAVSAFLSILFYDKFLVFQFG